MMKEGIYRHAVREQKENQFANPFTVGLNATLHKAIILVNDKIVLHVRSETTLVLGLEKPINLPWY
jgi:hypothetical protein